MTVLGAHYGEELTSATLTSSVGAHEALVRKVLSRLVKAGLVQTSRGRNGYSTLARPADKINLLEIYKAVDPPPVFSIHEYPKAKKCKFSCSHKEVLKDVLEETQKDFEESLKHKTLSELVEKARQYR